MAVAGCVLAADGVPVAGGVAVAGGMLVADGEAVTGSVPVAVGAPFPEHPERNVSTRRKWSSRFVFLNIMILVCSVRDVGREAMVHSPARVFQRSFGKPGSFDSDLCRRIFDLVQIVGRKFDVHCPDVLLQAMQLPCARDGYNPRFLRQQPGKCNSCGRGALAFRDAFQKSDQGQVGLPILRRKARRDVAEIRAIKGCAWRRFSRSRIPRPAA